MTPPVSGGVPEPKDDRLIRQFYDADVKHKAYGAHTVTYEEFFRRLAEAYQWCQIAKQDALNQCYVRGPLGGLSGTQIKALWEAV